MTAVILCIMTGNTVCSRDDCPPANVRKDSETNCGKCGVLLHLPCLGITKTTKQVLFHQNIKVFCNKCVQETSSSPAETSTTTTISIGKIQTEAPIMNENLNVNYSNNSSSSAGSASLDKILSLLNKINNSVEITKDMVDQHRLETKINELTLHEIKEATIEVKEKVDKSKGRPLFSSIAANTPMSQFISSDSSFPRLERHNSKRRRGDAQTMTPNETPKSAFKSRQLTAGTSQTTDHGLGSPVKVKQFARARSNLTKSLYVSRLQTTVTIDRLLSYIKGKIPEVKENDMALRMLVKKDQPLDELTFVSYRLMCTDGLYEKFADAAFWPAHVKIGEFIDKPRQPKIQVAAFESPSLVNPNDEKNNGKSIDEKMETEVNSKENDSLNRSSRNSSGDRSSH